VWRPARAGAGLDVPPYALRHTFASLLIAEGRNPWQVAHLMGHSNLEMVIRTYGHLFAEAELAGAARWRRRPSRAKR
jgi:integrase